MIAANPARNDVSHECPTGTPGKAVETRSEVSDRDTRTSPFPTEGDTKVCMLGPTGAVFETEFRHHESNAVLFKVLWFNADADGFMDEANGDRILSVQYVRKRG